MARDDFGEETTEPTTFPEIKARAVTEEDLPTPPRGYLVVIKGETVGRRFEIGQEFVVGRASSAQLQLSSSDVSRIHARVRAMPDGSFIVEDLDSHNGTMVNGTPITKERLSFGDRIQIGAHTVLLFTFHDDLGEQLLQSQKMESIGRLAGGIAHDFNNLLGAMLNNLDFLEDIDPAQTLNDGDVRACLDDIRLAANRAAELTRQMLAFSRQGKYEDKPTSISTLVEEVVGMVRRTFDRVVDVRTNIEPRLFVRGDRTQLQQVLMNLCLNARDAMPQGGRLSVSVAAARPKNLELPLRTILGAGPQVVVTVSDSGCGMDAATRERVFEPFFTTKPAGQGTGLGLATVWGIVKNHGGHVDVSSKPGEGATFRVFLPAAERRRDAPETAQLTQREPEASTGTVLLVDDEAVVRNSTARLLRKLGYTVLVAEDGEVALELFRQHPDEVDLVILDLIMPTMNGEATFEALLEIKSKVKVLVTSGYTDETRVAAMLARGARGFLPKPFDSSALLRAIQYALEPLVSDVVDP